MSLATRLAAGVFAVLALSAFTRADDDGALVFHGGNCRIGFGGFPAIVTTDAHLVLTPSGNGSLSCHGQLPEGSEPSSTVTIDLAGRCRLADGHGGVLVGTQGQVVYTPSGNVNLRCQFKK